MRDEFFRLLFFIGKKKKKKKETSTNNENALVGVSGQSADRECFLQCVLYAAVKRDGFFMIWRMKSLHARLRPQEDDASVINQRQMRNWSANQSETILPNSPKENCYYKKTTSFLTFANFFFEKTGRNWNPQPDFSSDSWPIFFFIFRDRIHHEG